MVTRWRIRGRAVFGVAALALALVVVGCSPPGTSLVPVYAKGITGATQIDAGQSHTCAVVAGGAIKCWGSDYEGELGDGQQQTTSSLPVDVVGVSGATQVSTGYSVSCALVAGGAVACWGSGYGLTPVSVVGVSGATQVVAGEGHSCALVAGGAVKCWGSNVYGELGNGTTGGGFSTTAVDVLGVAGATQIAAGGQASCAVVAGGSVTCWGRNGAGELGDGTTTDSSTPVDVVGVSGATEVSMGAGTSCALLAGGTAKCWGSNQTANLGNGDPSNVPVPTPVDVLDLSGATQITAGNAMTCALVVGGGVRCWGSNIYGTLGTWTPTYYSVTPLPVTGVAATQVASGGIHSCALVAGGAVKCWGADFAGQLGDGTTYP